MKKRNKKIYFIIILVIVILVTGIILSRKIEAPIAMPEPAIENKVLNNIKNEETATPIKDSIKNQETKKYKIIDRSTVAKEDTTDKAKIVLLTVDDGPSKRTKEMLDILNKHNAKAIFFINGMHDKDNKGVMKEINDEGFAVGNHTWSHLNLKREKNIKTVEKEIDTNTDLIAKETGVKPRFFRAPYGESNSYIRKIIQDDGMIFMDWSGAAKDWEKSAREKDVFVNNVMKDIHSGSIILIHEHPWSITNLDALLTDLESKGYTYVDPKDIVE